jgi:hypothetical protein
MVYRALALIYSVSFLVRYAKQVSQTQIYKEHFILIDGIGGVKHGPKG